MSSFSGLHLSLSSLMSQRRGMEVTGQNIANANTPGYTRQRAEMAALPGSKSAAQTYATWNGIGQGVEVTGVRRINDAFLDARVRVESGNLAGASERAATLARIEDLSGEPGDAGLSTRLDEYWAAWGDVSNNPQSIEARSALLQKAAAVVDTLGGLSRSLDSLAAATGDQANALTSEANNAARGIAELNTAIRSQTLLGKDVGELADQREQLAVRLAELTGAQLVPGPDGMVEIVLGGQSLVSGQTSTPLSITPTATAGIPGPPVTVAVGGTPVTLGSGRLSAVVGSLTTVVPGVRQDLDAVASRLADSVNTLHRTGQGLPPAGDPTGPRPTGVDFFTGTTAATLAVAITDQRQVAATATTESGVGGGLADQIGKLADAADGPDKRWSQFVVDLGVRADAANRTANVQGVVTRQANTARIEVSGVSIDEEMTNLMAFQRAYEGSSRVLTAVDQMLDVLINRTGLVGR